MKTTTILGLSALGIGGFMVYKYYDYNNKFKEDLKKPFEEQKFVTPASPFQLITGGLIIGTGAALLYYTYMKKKL